VSEGTRTPDRLDHNPHLDIISGESAAGSCSEMHSGSRGFAHLRATWRATAQIRRPGRGAGPCCLRLRERCRRLGQRSLRSRVPALEHLTTPPSFIETSSGRFAEREIGIAMRGLRPRSVIRGRSRPFGGPRSFSETRLRPVVTSLHGERGDRAAASATRRLPRNPRSVNARPRLALLGLDVQSPSASERVGSVVRRLVTWPDLRARVVQARLPWHHPADCS
jgi:hypothetical protein